MGDNDEKSDKKKLEGVVVKGYMRPDGTSYYVAVPREVRDILGLKGGEHFLMQAKPEKREIKLKMVKFVEETV